VTPLPSHLLGCAKRLRKLRNRVAHTGTTPSKLDRKEAAKLLSALFVLRYVALFRQQAGLS